MRPLWWLSPDLWLTIEPVTSSPPSGRALRTSSAGSLSPDAGGSAPAFPRATAVGGAAKNVLLVPRLTLLVQTLQGQ